jgi:hypothetical protein
MHTGGIDPFDDSPLAVVFRERVILDMREGARENAEPNGSRHEESPL